MIDKAGQYSINQRRAINTIRFLLYVIFFLIIFEGPFRKWIIPQFHQIVLFIKDFVLVYVCFLVVKYKFLPNDYFTKSILLLNGFLFIFGLLHSLFLQIPIIVVFYGLRNYFFVGLYASFMGRFFTITDVYQIVKIIFWVAVPTIILVYFQVNGDMDSFINKGTGEAGEKVFYVVSGVVRPYGFFTFTIGHAYYVNLLMSMLIGYYLSKHKRLKINNYFLLFLSIGGLYLLFSSGARSCILYLLILFVFVFITLFTTASDYIRTKIFSLIFIGLIGTSIILVLNPASFENLVDRFESASGKEDTDSRVLEMYTSFIKPIQDNIPLMGGGVGVTTGGGTFLMFGQRSIFQYENDIAKVVYELGPIVGIMVFLLRYLFSIYILIKGMAVSLKLQNLMPICLANFSAHILQVSNFYSQNTVLYFGWFSIGLLLVYFKYADQVKVKNKLNYM